MAVGKAKAQRITAHGIGPFNHDILFADLQLGFIGRMPLHFCRRRKHAQKLVGKRVAAAVVKRNVKSPALTVQRHIGRNQHVRPSWNKKEKAAVFFTRAASVFWCRRRESNPHHNLRRVVFYPLKYGDGLLIIA